MGMAASQVRFLSLQNRKNTVGMNLLTLSNRKASLSRDMNRVAAKYNEEMNIKNLKWSNDSGVTYSGLSYDLMMKQNVNNASTPYIISTADGKVVVDDKMITDADGNKYNNLSYKDLAKYISQYSGTSPDTGSVTYNFTDRLSADGNSGSATKQGYEYQIATSGNTYDFNNTLRYDLFEKMGIITPQNTKDFQSINDSLYGDEIGFKYGNYNDLLEKYVKADPKLIDADGTSAHYNFSTGEDPKISLDKVDGSGTVERAASTYFGKWDTTTGKITGGSKVGNLALAKYDLQQYYDWCNIPHDISLTDETPLTFTGLSGHSVEQKIKSVMSAFDNDTTQTCQSVVAPTMTFTDSLGRTSTKVVNWYHNSSSSSWENILTTTDAAAVGVTGWGASQIEAYLITLGNGLLDTFSNTSNKEYSNTSGSDASYSGWSLVNRNNNDNQISVKETTDASGVTTKTTLSEDLAQKASEWALNQTINFYAKTWKDSTSCGRSYDSGQEEDSANDGKDNNGVSYEKRKYRWYEAFVNALIAVTTSPFQLVADTLNGELENNFQNFGHIAYGSNTGYSFNTKDFIKTYFTYYQMYMITKGDLKSEESSTLSNDNSLIDGLDSTPNSNGKGGVTVTAATYNTSGINTNTYTYKDINGNTKTGTTQIKYTGKSDDTYTDSNGVHTGFTVYVSDTPPIHTSNTEIYNDAAGNVVTVTIDSDHNRTVTYENKNGLQIPKYNEDGSIAGYTTYCDKDSKNYTKCIETTSADGDVTDKYYQGSTEVTGPQKTVTGLNIIAGDNCTEEQKTACNNLKIVNGAGSQFTNTIAVYITPNAACVKELQKAIDDATDDLAATEASRENVFSEEEKKKMDYFDPIFQRISQNGWVYDAKVNSSDKENSTNQTQENANKYLNAMLQNNMYYVTEVGALNQTSYSYTNKLATNISKIFQVQDTDEQNTALSEYEAEKAEISSKEEQVDLRMSRLETEQSAIKTELDSVKKIIDDNVTSTFKIFS